MKAKLIEEVRDMGADDNTYERVYKAWVKRYSITDVLKQLQRQRRQHKCNTIESRIEKVRGDIQADNGVHILTIHDGMSEEILIYEKLD